MDQSALGTQDRTLKTINHWNDDGHDLGIFSM